MAHKKGQGSTRNGRDSNPQYRSVKAYGGQSVKAGSIIGAAGLVCAYLFMYILVKAGYL